MVEVRREVLGYMIDFSDGLITPHFLTLILNGNPSALAVYKGYERKYQEGVVRFAEEAVKDITEKLMNPSEEFRYLAKV